MTPNAPLMSRWESSGCDLMKQPGEIANWLVEWQKTLPASAKVMIGNYTYLDGDLHVKLALCADYCIQKLRKARPSTVADFYRPPMSPNEPKRALNCVRALRSAQ